jgi:hypothetical protein
VRLRFGGAQSSRRLAVVGSRQVDARLASGIAPNFTALTPSALTPSVPIPSVPTAVALAAAAFTGAALTTALAATLPAVGPTFGAIAGIALPAAGLASAWPSVTAGGITAAATFAATARGATFAATLAAAASIHGRGIHGIDARARPFAHARTFDGHRR